jgi:hypothetical protein
VHDAFRNQQMRDRLITALDKQPVARFVKRIVQRAVKGVARGPLKNFGQEMMHDRMVACASGEKHARGLRLDAYPGAGGVQFLARIRRAGGFSCAGILGISRSA